MIKVCPPEILISTKRICVVGPTKDSGKQLVFFIILRNWHVGTHVFSPQAWVDASGGGGGHVCGLQLSLWTSSAVLMLARHSFKEGPPP